MAPLPFLPVPASVLGTLRHPGFLSTRVGGTAGETGGDRSLGGPSDLGSGGSDATQEDRGGLGHHWAAFEAFWWG